MRRTAAETWTYTATTCGASARRTTRSARGSDAREPRSSLAAQFFEPRDKAGGAWVLSAGWRSRRQQRQDAPGDLLSQFHAPLVEAVDVPQATLHSDLMLVERDQPSHGEWIEAPKQD